MADLYRENEYCMAFSDEIIKKNFNIIGDMPNVKLEYGYFDECSESYMEFLKEQYKDCDEYLKNNKYLNKIHKIDSISFDGEKGDFGICFFEEGMVGLYFLDEMFLFVDDNLKKDLRRIEGCIFYEGTLRDKTHRQILSIFLELFKILYGSVGIESEAHLVSTIEYYRKYNYTIKLKKPGFARKIIQFENILFQVN